MIVVFIAFGVTFEVPVIVFVLVLTGLVSVEKLREIRPYVIVGAFVVAAVVTPPDVLSQLLLAIPLLLWLAVWSIGVVFAAIYGWFAALFTGRLPNGLHNFFSAYVRYTLHMSAYDGIAANPYPGFTGDPGYPVDVVLPGGASGVGGSAGPARVSPRRPSAAAASSPHAFRSCPRGSLKPARYSWTVCTTPAV